MTMWHLIRRSALALLTVWGTSFFVSAPEDGVTETNACDGRHFVAPRRQRPQVGLRLVATERMPDAAFRGAEIYLVEHGPRGTVGVITNRPLQLRHAPLTLHDGGPVGKDAVLFLHSQDYTAAGTVALGPGVALTATPDAIHDVLEGKGPARWFLAWGYAGWKPGQLEGELATGVWRLEEGSPSFLVPFTLP
ncbi:MAG: YqgE/AlgH family protein [Myxococcota bacterium]